MVLTAASRRNGEKMKPRFCDLLKRIDGVNEDLGPRVYSLIHREKPLHISVCVKRSYLAGALRSREHV